MSEIIDALKSPYAKLLGGPILCLQFLDDMLIATDQGGSILTRADFEEVVGYWQNFYARYSDKDIEDLEEESRQIRAARAALLPAQRKVSRSQAGYIYLARCDTGHYKIGKSNSPNGRIKVFNTKMPLDVSVVHTFQADDMGQAETALHEQYADKRIKGEWFELVPEDVEAIIAITGYQNGGFTKG